MEERVSARPSDVRIRQVKDLSHLGAAHYTPGANPRVLDFANPITR